VESNRFGLAFAVGVCAACAAATLPPAPVTRERSQVQFAHPGGPGTTLLPNPSDIGVGDRWGCAAFAGDWQCWDARGQQPWLTGLKAHRVPWLAHRAVRFEADRVCTRDDAAAREQCWSPPAPGRGPGTALPTELRPPELRPRKVRPPELAPPPHEGPDLSWGVLPPERACWMRSERLVELGSQPGLVTCKGPGYSPPEDLDRRLTVQFEPAIPVAETAVVTLPHGAPDDSCLIRQRCRGAPIALHRCGFFSRFAIGNALSDVLPDAEFRPAGEKVSVRGILGVGAAGVAPVGCDASCCSQSFAPVVLAGATDVLGLQGLSCRGDDSELCCDAPAYGQTVIATGRLVLSMGAWMLDDPEICILGP
jgi:hypothetical protein